MALNYLLTPFIAWFLCGCLKFAFNTMKSGRLSFRSIGYGGMPSNHAAISSSVASLIAFSEGVENGLFSLSVAFVFIVCLDAMDLRRKIGSHAEVINRLNRDKAGKKLRERMGHKPVEVAAGLLLGVLIGFFLSGLEIRL